MSDWTTQAPDDDARRFSDLSTQSPGRTLRLGDWVTQPPDSSARRYSDMSTQDPRMEVMPNAPVPSRDDPNVHDGAVHDEILPATPNPQARPQFSDNDVHSVPLSP